MIERKHGSAKSMPQTRGRRLLWSMSTNWSIAAILAFGLLIRAAVGLHPYSDDAICGSRAGENTPPLFGDYEAQRHWMEIAFNLNATDWYRSTTDNDLDYWGLDYPPLSGYASLLFGKLLSRLEPATVQLHNSRGYESATSRAAMRLTVLISDIFVFFPALLYASFVILTRNHAATKPSREQTWNALLETIAFCLSAPSFVLIDHGHFQYNNISLGLFLLSLAFFGCDRAAAGAALFCCSIYFKQMSLYYGLAVFSYLLGQMTTRLRSREFPGAVVFASKILISIALTTVASFGPWIRNKEHMNEVLHRLFPVSRGLYEGKVANVWCSISVIIKIHKLMSQEVLVKFSAGVTTLASLPFCAAVFLRPTPKRLCLAAGGCALAAYLFSYQVHEKQVLIPLLPICLLYHDYPLIVSWTSFVAVFSMFPLLHREGLLMAYVATVAIHIIVIKNTISRNRMIPSSHTATLCIIGFLIGAILHLALLLVEPPPFAPDIFELANTSYACLHLCFIYLLMLHRTWLCAS